MFVHAPHRRTCCSRHNNKRIDQRTYSRSSAPAAFVRHQQREQQNIRNSSSSAVVYRDDHRRSSCSSGPYTNGTSISNDNDRSNDMMNNMEVNRSLQETETPQLLNPLVAMLLRGEELPVTPTRKLVTQPILNGGGFEACNPGRYREQIKICVANPGRFSASWAMLVAVFGEIELYDYVRKCAWTREQLKPFVISEELENEKMVDEYEFVRP